MTAFQIPNLLTSRGKPAALIGPQMLHHDSNKEAYMFLLQHISNKLEKDETMFMISDSELAINVAVEKSFPNLCLMNCCQHLYNNCKHNLSGVGNATKYKTLTKYFGQKGALTATSKEEYDSIVATIDPSDFKEPGYKEKFDQRLWKGQVLI